MKKSNREVYVGCWRNGQRNGWGKVYSPLGKMIQNGEFLNGCLLLRNRQISWYFDKITKEQRVLSLFERKIMWTSRCWGGFLSLQKFYCLFFLIKFKFNKIKKIHNRFPPSPPKFLPSHFHFHACLIPNIHIFPHLAHDFFPCKLMPF